MLEHKLRTYNTKQMEPEDIIQTAKINLRKVYNFSGYNNEKLNRWRWYNVRILKM